MTTPPGRTPWTDPTDRPLLAFLRTETGSAGLLLAATLLALLWANSPFSDAYDDLWGSYLTIDFAGAEIREDLRHWVNDGLMALFFFVIGLEVRRGLTLGELRDRRAAAVPALAALAGMAVPALVYTAFNAGGEGAHGWGIVMATDIAFVLGALALLGPRVPTGVRIFLLMLAIVDDIGAIAVIAVFYAEAVDLVWLGVAAALLAAVVVGRRFGEWRGPVYAVAGVAVWVAVLESGVHPTIAGVLMGMLVAVHPPRRADIERAANLARVFRREPSAAAGRAATLEVSRSVSASERFQAALHPWTSYVIVPLFALANAGVALDGEALSRALRSPITLGVVAGLVLGKAVGIATASGMAVRLGIGPLPSGVGRRHLAGAATLAGIGFTVSLFVAELAFEDPALRAEAKIGVLAASLIAALAGYALLRRAGGGERDAPDQPAPELAVAVDPEFDQIGGPRDAPLTLVAYGDYACPHTRAVHPVLGELRRRLGDDLRVVWRHLPIEDVHPQAPLAAEAAEAAGEQGRFWAMHDRLLTGGPLLLDPGDLVAHAEALGLDVEHLAEDLRHRVHAPAVAQDVDGARRSGVPGTPSFFVGGRLHTGGHDADALEAALRSR